MSDPVLAGTDFSESARCATDQALRLASALGAPLVIAHAWADFSP